jgi:hypothetical protein
MSTWRYYYTLSRSFFLEDNIREAGVSHIATHWCRSCGACAFDPAQRVKEPAEGSSVFTVTAAHIKPAFPFLPPFQSFSLKHPHHTPKGESLPTGDFLDRPIPYGSHQLYLQISQLSRLLLHLPANSSPISHSPTFQLPAGQNGAQPDFLHRL